MGRNNEIQVSKVDFFSWFMLLILLKTVILLIIHDWLVISQRIGENGQKAGAQENRRMVTLRMTKVYRETESKTFRTF